MISKLSPFNWTHLAVKMNALECGTALPFIGGIFVFKCPSFSLELVITFAFLRLDD